VTEHLGQYDDGEPFEYDFEVQLAADTTLPVFKFSLVDKLRIRLASWILGKRLWRQWRQWYDQRR
jgi:hypothetical protein